MGTESNRSAWLEPSQLLFAWSSRGKKSTNRCGQITINNNDAAKPIALPAQPNVAGGLGSYYIGKLIDEEKKSEGRQKKYKEEKDSINTKEEKAEKILQMAKVSSSVLAANNHFVLGPEVLELVHKNEQTMELKKLESKRKQDEAKKKLDDKYWNAMRKAANKSALTVDDMKSVLMRHKQPGDSPIQINKWLFYLRETQEQQLQVHHKTPSSCED